MNTLSPEIADLALEPPILNLRPLPQYGYDQLDYGMTIGIERTAGGRLWACWVGGGDNDKAFFVLATSEDRGKMWSDPRMVIDPHRPDLPYPRRTIVGNLWRDPQNRLWLFFDQSLSHFDGRAGTWAVWCDEPDAAIPIWSEPVRLWHGCALNKPIVRSNGEWLLVISLWDRGKIGGPFREAFSELDPFRMANVFISSDQGQSWQRRGGVAFPNPEFDEAQVIERRDGSLWMTGRTHHGLWESESGDGGTNWSAPVPARIAHVNSRHFLRRLQSGHLLLVKHGLKPNERPPATPYSPNARSFLTAFLSRDDGVTWEGGLRLDERAGVSYPDGTQEADGSILISYDYERDTRGEILFARFTEADVLVGTGSSPGFALRQLISRPSGIARRKAQEAAQQQ